MILAQGNVNASPFARTVFSLAAKRFTGDLILSKSRKEYRSSWENGQIVAANSPSPADSAGRVALANGLVNSTSLGIIVQKLIDEPHKDPVEVVAQIANLNPQQALTLRHHVLCRTAARMFALPDAEFVVDNARTMRASEQIPPLDIRWLIYFGLRTHYSLTRLKQELAAVGDRGIRLPAKALPMLPAFGFTAVEAPLLERMQSLELSFGNLVDATPEVDPATTACVVYALMACGYLAYGESQVLRTPPPPEPTIAKVAPAKVAPAKGASGKGVKGASHATVQGVGFVDIKPGNEEAVATQELIRQRLALLRSDCNHYQTLGIAEGAPDAEIRKGYFQLARKLHPDHLQAIGIVGLEQDVQMLFAAINKAFAVLSNAKERFKYQEIMAAGGEKAYERKRKEAEDLAVKILRAEEHFYLGEMALRRDHFSQAATEFKKATDLHPAESEYQALYAWAFLCNSSDREIATTEALQLISSAVLKGPNNVTVALYHAKLLKLVGRTNEAVDAFRKVLQLDPKSREAQLELRLLTE